MSEILRSENLTVGYGSDPVVREITLAAEPGRILCLIGPNGAGKSTLLKTLIRQLPPLAGTVVLEGEELKTLPERELARRSAAVLTGRPAPELMLCREVVAAGRYPYTGRLGLLSGEDQRIVRESMEMTQTSELADTDFTRISDGQRQRVMLARAICQQPRLLILDEPTSFLDIRHKLEFLELLRGLARQRQIAVVLSMHELDLAQKFSDMLLCLKDGRIDRSGTPEEIFRGDYVRELYGLTKGSYDAVAGTAEGEPARGEPRVFVLGGGGQGIPVYRALQRRGIPFAAGVLPENDLDLPTALALAAVVITDRANEPVSREKVDEALAVLESCEALLCVTDFGTVNRENRRLLQAAKESGKLCGIDDLLTE